MIPTSDPRPVVLFDGVCNLCDASVHFIIDRDPASIHAFASLQSPVGQELSRRFELPTSDPGTLILVEGNRHFVRSTAALRIARRLRQPWPLLYGLMIIPRSLRDAIYNLIARNRYRWFGRRDSCRVPTPETAARFLNSLV